MVRHQSSDHFENQSVALPQTSIHTKQQLPFEKESATILKMWRSFWEARAENNFMKNSKLSGGIAAQPPAFIDAPAMEVASPEATGNEGTTYDAPEGTSDNEAVYG